MPGQIGWLIQNQVAYIKSGQVVTDDEFGRLVTNLNNIADRNPDATLHLLIDNSQLLQQPSLQTQAKAKSNRSNNGWVFVIGQQNPILRFGSSVAAQIARLNIRLVDTLPEAIAILERVDPNIKIPQPIDWQQWETNSTTYDDMANGKSFS